MKCGTKTIAQLTPQQRKRLIDEVQKGNELFLKGQCARMRAEITNNLFKLFVISANETCGIGKERLEKILATLNSHVIESEKDEIFWQHVDSACKRILGEEKYKLYFREVPFELGGEA